LHLLIASRYFHYNKDSSILLPHTYGVVVVVAVATTQAQAEAVLLDS
jgi:hypothetical protein